MSEEDLLKDVGILDLNKKPSYTKLKETPKSYLERLFPKKDGECFSKHMNVGHNNFRVNFFVKEDPDNLFTNFKISRSYYVVLKETEKAWEHTVL